MKYSSVVPLKEHSVKVLGQIIQNYCIVVISRGIESNCYCGSNLRTDKY